MNKIITYQTEKHPDPEQRPFIPRGLTIKMDDVDVCLGIIHYKNNEYYIWSIEVLSKSDKNINDLLKKFECDSVDEFNDGIKEIIKEHYNIQSPSKIH